MRMQVFVTFEDLPADASMGIAFGFHQPSTYMLCRSFLMAGKGKAWLVGDGTRVSSKYWRLNGRRYLRITIPKRVAVEGVEQSRLMFRGHQRILEMT
jgi:hypothetical protein